MRTAYLGTSEFAAEVLRDLVAAGRRPQLVVTPPDRRAGRGRQSKPPPAALAAAELGIELLQAETVNAGAAGERIEALDPDAVIVCAFGQMIREPLLSDRLVLNVHPSLLPRWRGAAPIERAIMAGDERTGVCVMRLDEGLDSGPIALRTELPIDPEDDYEALAERLRAAGSALLVRALDEAAAGTLELVPQVGEPVYAEKIDSTERRIDVGGGAVRADRLVRALTPHIGAYLEVEPGERLGVRRARPVAAEIPAGTVTVADGALLVGFGADALSLEVVQAPGKRPMDVGSYLRGHEPPRRAL